MSSRNIETNQPSALDWTQYIGLKAFVGAMRIVPRTVARSVGIGLGSLVYRVAGGLRATGSRNLQLAFPEKPQEERKAILKSMFRHLGLLLAEFCQMSGYSANFARGRLMRYEGLENYLVGSSGAGAFWL